MGARSRADNARHLRGKYKNVARSVLINNWEATYLDFTGDKIIGIARQAAELGMDMFFLCQEGRGAENSVQSALE